jgi:hypothetical protein
MARNQIAAKEQPAAAPVAELEPLPTAAESAKGPSDDRPAYAPDPHEKLSVSLSDVRGGPAMHLLRSHRYNQLQVRFDHGQPDEKFLKMLTDAGWRDRTQEEGVFTKQIDRDAKWQAVARMEEEFKHVANEIRQSRGLGPVLKELGA